MRVEERPHGKWVLLSDSGTILLMVSNRKAAIAYGKKINKKLEQESRHRQ